MTIYKTAVANLTIAKLSEFLKTDAASAILEIEGWGDMRAPAKRDEFMSALLASVEFRKLFADFHNATVTPDHHIDWMAAEKQVIADAETVPDATPDVAPTDTPTPDAAPVPTGEILTTTPSSSVEATKPLSLSFAASLPGAPMVGQYVEGAFDQIVADAAGLSADQANQAVHAAEEDLEFNHLRLGVLLNHVNTAQHYKALGYETLQDYLDAETGLHYRKAMNLIKNALTVKELGIPAKDLKGVTWAALRHIVPVLTGDNYKVWMEAARSMKHVSLIAAVKTEQAKVPPVQTTPKSGTTPADSGISQKVFAVYPDQKSNIDAAIEKAKAEAKVESQGAALDIIAAAYNATPPASSSVPAPMPVSVSGSEGGLPDLTTPALTNYFSKIMADEGDAGCVRLLNIIGELWPHIDINVDFQPEAAETAA